jgi:tRNA threonylcarbamoyl adenosine modification protein (Sua5/YciO/YrdC/YwlC family)/tRNA threonylcarbamoyl adenosine modification protein YjeE
MKLIPFDLKHYQPSILEALQVLKNGGLVIYPTETCYGLGALATNNRAVEQLLAYKGGRQNKAVAVAVADSAMAHKYVEINPTAYHVMDELLPGPVTVVCRDKGVVAHKLVSTTGTLGIRIPDYSPTLALIRALKLPITATSANTSGKKAPYSYDDLRRYTTAPKLDMIDLFLDAGPLPRRMPSTVVDTTTDTIEVLRGGEVIFDTALTTTTSTHSPTQTQNVAFLILRQYVEKLGKSPVVFALSGPLGAGKTQLVKGIAQALQITDTIQSPTYQVIREYPHQCGKVSGKLVHIDTWRLENITELTEWRVETYLTAGTVVAIEWMERAVEWIRQLPRPLHIVWIEITGSGDSPRTIRYIVEWLQ